MIALVVLEEAEGIDEIVRPGTMVIPIVLAENRLTQPLRVRTGAPRAGSAEQTVFDDFRGEAVALFIQRDSVVRIFPAPGALHRRAQDVKERDEGQRAARRELTDDGIVATQLLVVRLGLQPRRTEIRMRRGPDQYHARLG